MRAFRIWISAACVSAALAAQSLVGCSWLQEQEEEFGETTAAATVQEPNFTDSTFVTGLSSPTSMTFAPDGRLFVSEKRGNLRVIKNGQLLPTPFMSLTVNDDNERGLMGIAFDPDFATNQYIYVFYTSTAGSVHNRVSRFRANGDVVVPGSEQVIIDLPTLGAANHNGGTLNFGNDGKLYISVGDNAVGDNSQSLNTPLGKMLRFNPDGTIPSDNPYFTATTGQNRAIWAVGLRNPFTFAVQRTTGKIFINDVGGGGWEEINLGIAGANYGWPRSEGATTNPAYTSPFFAYPHGSGTSAGICIAGGVFYNPVNATFPSAFVGQYFFADYGNNWIRRIDPNTGATALFATGVPGPVDLDVGPDGALYYLGRTNNAVGRIAYAAAEAPSIVQQPANAFVSLGQTATFTVSASGAPPLSYQWQRNGAPIAGATSSSYRLENAQLADSGAKFRVVVSNQRGSATSTEATLTVTNNRPPVATITAPTLDAKYTAGTTLNFSGSASDTEDAEIPASAYTWRIDFHHDTHHHPAMPDTPGIRSGSWAIPSAGETSANVWYRVHLTVRDSAGLTHSTFRDLFPNKSTFTIATLPAGLGITLDGQPFTSPQSIESVVGVVRSIGVTSPQTLNGKKWVFSKWSDGRAQTHDITTPATATTYTAEFVESATSGCASELLTASGAVSSSVENGGLVATNAIDGNPGTRWSSAFSDPQWIYVDLGASRFVNRVVLDWEAAASRDYSVEISDSSSGPWQELYRTTTGDGGSDDIQTLEGIGRYVRIYSRARTTGYGNSLWEIRVYGDPSASCDSSDTGDAGTPDDDGGSSGGELSFTSCSSTGAFQTPPNSAIDKNEGSRFTNDGQLTTASLTCNLSATGSVSKLRLLMYAGTTRTYPVRVSVGSTVVFTGNTVAGSGYFEIPFSATSGSNVTITMTGPNSSNNTWLSIWELQAFE